MPKFEHRGRPHLVAIVPFNPEEKMALLDRFYSVCRTFKYQEIVQLSRGMGLTTRTIESWKYGQTFPRYDIALAVIAWDQQGRPAERRLPYRHGIRPGVM